MRKFFLALAVTAICAAFSGEVFACGPEGSLAGRGSKGFNSFGALPANGYRGYQNQQFMNPIGVMSAMQQRQIDQARANFGAQAAAYRTRMEPIRKAAAQQKRQEMLAKRQSNRERIMAQEQARRAALQQQQEIEQQQREQQARRVEQPSRSPFVETRPVNRGSFAYTSFFE